MSQPKKKHNICTLNLDHISWCLNENPTNLDKATLSGVIDRMVDSGWLNKTQEESDKRIFRLYPSEKADRLKEQLVDERKNANEELLSGFTMEERILLRPLLSALL